MVTIGGDHFEEFHAALTQFLGNTDPKASLLAPVIYIQAFKGVRLFLYLASSFKSKT